MKSAVHPENEAARERVTKDYRLALEQFLSGAGESALQQAYEIGRGAVAGGIGVLEMALLHCTAVDEILAITPAANDAARLRKAATGFFLESLAPHEMAYRGFQEANRSLRHLNELLEEQARKIAHAIHDEAGQLLIAVHLALTELTGESSSSMRPRLQEVNMLLAQIQQELRDLSHELRPTVLDDLGLQPALEFLAQRMSQRGSLRVTVEFNAGARLPAALELVMYRVAQEALANAVRHSQARSVKIKLEQAPGSLSGAIRDDGVGFDVATVLSPGGKRGLGLAAMRERIQSVGGTLQIESGPGQGTALLISIPLEESYASSSLSCR